MTFLETLQAQLAINAETQENLAAASSALAAVAHHTSDAATCDKAFVDLKRVRREKFLLWRQQEGLKKLMELEEMRLQLHIS